MNDTHYAAISGIRRRLGSDLAILAHHYQHDDVVRHADHVGDSLELARLVPDIAARHIVFCGVYFMAETAAMLAGPGQKVFIPASDARCVMSEMAPAGLVEAVYDRLARSGRRIIPLAYVNSSAAVKALCGRHGGAVCTSANAAMMLAWAMDQGDAALFLPDRMLAQNTCRTLGLPAGAARILDVRAGGGRLDERAAEAAPVLVWPGQCAIHARFKPALVERARQAMPGALVAVHPECPPETVAAADAAGSTSFLIQYAAKAPKGSTVVIGTECHLVDRLTLRHAGEKNVLPLARSLCSNMAKVTEASLAALLGHIETAGPVTVPASIGDPAALAVRRMLEVRA